MTALAEQLLDVARGMTAARLSVGTAGNVSVRNEAGFLVTPSGMAPERCEAADMTQVAADGTPRGRRAPSSEWRLHRDIYAARPEIYAILHAHAPFATALACQRFEVPAFHYMVARFGGDSVRCGAYATFGTQALSDATLAALAGRSAALMANHGMIVLADRLDTLLDRAIEFETLCEHYWRARALGEPPLLDAAQMTDALDQFHWYGRPRPLDTDTPT
ncbi:class II aldolase/adducin family protein [Denitromonas iodatirespirans]|uniref:Class II aldolase/adducin family protein n=1 Tax=Denitromonas iodatirespirans TaxID=2795389 RepID=A0A944D965_DENI1|nr:class II aldolase/adducin family protein [Denitromonas iodatirespirans]MBT0962105.1 class II aldolase/adducin family protein [Denitromonas iodatirespirans]